MSIPTLYVEVDWNDDGDYTDTYDVITADVQDIRITRGRDGPLGMAEPARLELVLKNTDGKYSPENSGSPLYGSLEKRRKIRAGVTSPTSKQLFIGRIDMVEVEPSLDARLARIEALDEMAYLLRESGPIFTPLTKAAAGDLEPDSGGQGPFTGEAIDAVLDEAGWPPPAGRLVDTGISEMDTYWAGGVDALSALVALCEEEIGFIWTDGAGILQSEDRAHRFKGVHLTSQATYTDDPTGARRYENISPYGLGVETVFNAARGRARPREGSAGDLWGKDLAFLGEVPALAPGESREFVLEWDNPASDTTSTAMTANAEADGGGDDLTAQVTKVNGTAKATRWPVTLTNDTDPPRTVYITALVAALNARVAAGEGAEILVEDTLSQVDYGAREFPFEAQKMGKTASVEARAGVAVALFKNPTPMIELTFGPYDTTILTEALTRELSERVTVVNGELGLNDDFHIERIGYEMRDTDKVFRTTMLLSKSPVDKGDPFWLLGKVAYGELGDNTRLFG